MGQPLYGWNRKWELPLTLKSTGKNAAILLLTISVLNPVEARRMKRHQEAEQLHDPDQCIHHCWQDNPMIESATGKQVSKMLHTVNHVRSRREATGETFQGTSDQFAENCKTYEKLKDCFDQCPESRLKRVAIEENLKNKEYCLPDGTRFPDYYSQLECISGTMAKHPSSAKCGPSPSISKVTFLQFHHGHDNDQHPAMVLYNTDQQQNDKECRKACEKLYKQYNCYKPILVKQCGQKAYDLYARSTKIQTTSELGMLSALGAISSYIVDCHTFTVVPAQPAIPNGMPLGPYPGKQGGK